MFVCISSPPPLIPPTRGGGKTFPPPRWGRSGGGAELLLHLIDFFVSVICNTLIEHPCSLLLIMFRIWKNKHGQTIPVQNIQGHDLSCLSKSSPWPVHDDYHTNEGNKTTYQVKFVRDYLINLP